MPLDKLLKSRLEPVQLSRRQSDRVWLGRRQLTASEAVTKRTGT